MPNVSRSQYRLFQAIAHHAKLKNKPEGLSAEKAQEFIDETPSYQALPEKKKKKSKLKDYLTTRRD